MTEDDDDPFDLCRFLTAQSGIYSRALWELKGGQKLSHWMWFIFPQIIGLGNSEMSIKYAIRSLDEASAYCAHIILGTRLRECTETVLAIGHRTAIEIFGRPDDMKLLSSMTLFEAASPELIFGQVVEKYFNGQRDNRTLQIVHDLT